MKGNVAPQYASFAGIGCALYSTAFFTGAYCLKEIRNVDDGINYAVSGALNSSIFVSTYLDCYLIITINSHRNLHVYRRQDFTDNRNLLPLHLQGEEYLVVCIP